MAKVEESKSGIGLVTLGLKGVPIFAGLKLLSSQITLWHGMYGNLSHGCSKLKY